MAGVITGFCSWRCVLGWWVLAQVSHSTQSQRIAVQKGGGAVRVVGTLTLMVGVAESTVVPASDRRIELPDVAVFLRNAVSGTGPEARRKRNSMEQVLSHGAGARQIHRLLGRARHRGWVRQAVQRRRGYGVSKGRAGEREGRVSSTARHSRVTTARAGCAIRSLRLMSSTIVTIFTSTNRVAQPAVRANTQGEYVFAGVKAGRYRMRGTCEKARGEAIASVGNAPAVANITLPNRAPKVGAVSRRSTMR